MRPRIWLFALFITFASSLQHLSSADAIPDGKRGCPVTAAPTPAFVPPSPHHSNPSNGSGYFLYGTPALWAYVHTDWQIHEGSKLPYFSEYLDHSKENDPRLSVVARRLDRPDPMVWAKWANHAWIAETSEHFITTGLDIPSMGCWEIAAYYNPAHDKTATLTYTVWVKP